MQKKKKKVWIPAAAIEKVADPLNTELFLKTLIQFCREDYVLSIGHSWKYLSWSIKSSQKIRTICGNSAFSQKLEHFLPQYYCKETSALFPLLWWINLFHPLNANSRIGQTHSNNSSWNCRRIVWVCLTILWDCGLKG